MQQFISSKVCLLSFLMKHGLQNSIFKKITVIYIGKEFCFLLFVVLLKRLSIF